MRTRTFFGGMVIIPILFLLVTSVSYGQKIVTNRTPNLSKIKTIFVEIEPNEKLEVYDEKNYLNTWKSTYEHLLLKVGFNVISRDKINSIIEEQKLQLSGLTRNESLYKVGEIIGSDGIIFIRVTFFSEDSFDEEVKLVSVETGEILFIGSFQSDDKIKPKESREKLIKTMFSEIKKSNK